MLGASELDLERERGRGISRNKYGVASYKHRFQAKRYVSIGDVEPLGEERNVVEVTENRYIEARS